MMIYDWSREKVEKYGTRIAISLGDEHINYVNLELESNRLAGQLIQTGFKPGSRVGLFMEKTPKTLIAMLGISKAGGVYVPLDFKSPAERVAKIIRSSDPALLFVDNHSIHHFQDSLHIDSELGHIPWVWWSKNELKYADDNPPVFNYDDIKSQLNIPHEVVRDENAAAQILFTSGSTGEPKGVVITHKNIKTFVNWAVHFFKMRAGERISCHSPLHFDLSTFDIYGAFASGSRLFLVPPEISLNPKQLSHFILDNNLNQWFSVPSALSYLAMFKAIPPGGFPSLKRMIWCGEVFPLPALQYWMKNLPDVQFTNMYGPTEATIASSYYTVPEVPEDFAEIPIGTACEGEKLLVLDENLDPVKKGEVGDLFISGEGLSPGYWNDQEKTDAAFIHHKNGKGSSEIIYKTGDLASLKKDGFIYFHGRSDYQIKSRGYRIELGEIEAALGQNEFLREYAVVPVLKNGFEGTAIGCAYVGTGVMNGDLAPDLKKKLTGKIPGYMIPHYWQEYEQLPRNGNGKIDRRKLADAFES
ncbi:MAG: amino acid adenylation domain-containing protein [Balneolaceae bacterium]|nr:amino acid adenylation domain-containing protein [Balneolaceae bacterium]